MIEAEFGEVTLRLETSPRLFSPGAIDRGTLAMLSLVEFRPEDRVLDLGCGYGAVGILAAKRLSPEQVVMCDVSPEAVELAKVNAARNQAEGVAVYESDGFRGFSEGDFTLILSNPPYHTDFAVAKHFIEEGRRRLRTGGRMVLVTKRRAWYENKLKAVFGGCRVWEKDGYFVFCAEKRADGGKRREKKPEQRLSRKLARKYGKNRGNNADRNAEN